MREREVNVTCEWVVASVEDYIDADGTLSAAERGALERHAARCADCRAELDAARAVVEMLRAIPDVPVPASVIDAAERAVEPVARVVTLPRPRTRAIQWIPSLVAAAALVTLVASTQWNPPTAPAPLATDESVEEAARETMLAFSYVNRYARRTGDILTEEVNRHVVGPVERTFDNEVMGGTLPPIRRAMEKSGIVETKSPHERS